MTIAKAPFVADELDRLLFATFPGLVIRKDLAQEISRNEQSAILCDRVYARQVLLKPVR